MARRMFSREFKREVVELVTARGVSAAQASRDLGKQAERFDRHLRRIINARRGGRYVRMDFEPDTASMIADGYHPRPKIYAQ